MRYSAAINLPNHPALLDIALKLEYEEKIVDVIAVA